MASHPPTPAYASFLGTGWSFPPAFNPAAGQVTMTSDEADIQASLKILLGTAAGERFLVPDYGLDLREQLFEPLSTTMTTLLKDRINVAILVYEPRIRLTSLVIDTASQLAGQMAIVLEYEIRATNSRFNLVYPFSFNDANEVQPARPAPGG
jgi:phage baseplate assembly protein W